MINQEQRQNLKDTTSKEEITLQHYQTVNEDLSQIKEVEESQNDMNVVDYEDLASFSRYKIGEDGTDHQIQIYQSYAKALQRRVRANLDKKAAMASLKAEKEQKNKLETQLRRIVAARTQKKELMQQKLKSKRDHLLEELRLQQQLKKALQSQLQTLQQLTALSNSTVSEFPRQKMTNYLDLMRSQSSSILTSGIKITHQLTLEQILLQNLEQIVSELPSQ